MNSIYIHCKLLKHIIKILISMTDLFRGELNEYFMSRPILSKWSASHTDPNWQNCSTWSIRYHNLIATPSQRLNQIYELCDWPVNHTFSQLDCGQVLCLLNTPRRNHDGSNVKFYLMLQYACIHSCICLNLHSLIKLWSLYYNRICMHILLPSGRGMHELTLLSIVGK